MITTYHSYRDGVVHVWRIRIHSSAGNKQQEDLVTVYRDINLIDNVFGSFDARNDYVFIDFRHGSR